MSNHEKNLRKLNYFGSKIFTDFTYLGSRLFAGLGVIAGIGAAVFGYAYAAPLLTTLPAAGMTGAFGVACILHFVGGLMGLALMNNFTTPSGQTLAFCLGLVFPLALGAALGGALGYGIGYAIGALGAGLVSGVAYLGYGVYKSISLVKDGIVMLMDKASTLFKSTVTPSSENTLKIKESVSSSPTPSPTATPRSSEGAYFDRTIPFKPLEIESSVNLIQEKMACK